MYTIIGADGKQYGPVSLDQLRQWLAEGRVNAQTLVQAAGTADWRALGTLPEFAAPAAAVPPPMTGGVPSVTPLGVRPMISNHLVPAILVTIFCCLPFGIAAIVFAAQVNSKLAAGDIAGAAQSSEKAKRWCWAAVLGWIVVVVLWWAMFGMAVRRGVPHRQFHF